jgi:hypothetical protein
MFFLVSGIPGFFYSKTRGFFCTTGMSRLFELFTVFHCYICMMIHI